MDINRWWIGQTGRKYPHMVIYTSRDGLPADQFNYNSAFKDKDGTLYFGTIKGMVSFNPTKSIKNSFIPPIFISDIQINNESIPVRENGILKQSISLSKEIQLSYNSSNISFNIAALSFVSKKQCLSLYHGGV
ncbi:hypothetical protein KUH03_07450 [Sphingobacterium sp. E70]|uniref:hypothetical protein n=1 Tax=Sphingobacterium sp. E70 TaxID=2853439 RepID=UPI00211BC289|nr:hypothetical protein [Sphingobacterium sp. E70]ULT26667.1 hypothetical protein KUH03_07450 [Sphingobacterium sp. E70]